MFVNVPFGKGNSILIRDLYLFKGYTAKKVAERISKRVERAKSSDAAKKAY